MSTKKECATTESQTETCGANTGCLEEEIRDLAYSKWETAGCPNTDDNQRQQFWLEAEQEILQVKSVSKKK